MKKKVSVAIAVYFLHIPFFREQLESINIQDYSNLEIIICDDSSDVNQFTLIKYTV
ncbi:hypothetical protein [Peribacillus cavernae]|uniref:hypothetical protein n=1 Tax=Peribacillus cavernae TaxID=1674310 RepID=UPI00163C1E89|nr:hypothetical protein [Peribacillus cavernae]MDQ0221222.1 glycosyltransferase involved in cell wall biosynthesis [Peribacillus cavernae]